MKRLATGLIAVAFAASIPTGVLAQTTAPGAKTDRGAADRGGTDRATTDRAKADRDKDKKERAAWNNSQGLHETGDIIGTAVEGADGKNVGKVDQLLIDPKDGKVSHAVIAMGGVLGVGGDKVVVPYSALRMTGHEGGRKARITIDQSALDQAPKYVKASERQPSASPATDRRSGTSSGSGGFSNDPRSTDVKRDADAKPMGDKSGAPGASQSSDRK